MYCVALATLLLGASSGVDLPRLGPVEIVADQALARKELRKHGVASDDVLPIRRSEADRVRVAIIPYLRAQVRESSEGDRPYFEAILAGIRRYRWHCAGHTYKKQSRLFCVAVSPGVERELLRDLHGGLPLIFDGGVAILNVLFDIDTRSVESFFWNGEA